MHARVWFIMIVGGLTGCIGSPVDKSIDTDIAVDTTDTEIPDTDVVDTDVDDTDVDPPDGDRSPGPHASEVDPLITAWQQLPDTMVTDYSAACTTLNADWGVLDPPAFTGGSYFYAFLRITTDLNLAVSQSCGGDYPDGCVDNSTIYDIDDHELVSSITVDEVLAGTCTLHLTTTNVIVDGGDVGTQTRSIGVDYSGDCIGLTANGGCVATHTWDLEWTDAR